MLSNKLSQVLFKEFVLIFMILNKVVCDNKSFKNDYGGEKFPEKYLIAEQYNPTTNDLNTYMRALAIVLDFFSSEANNTDTNIALTTFFVRAHIIFFGMAGLSGDEIWAMILQPLSLPHIIFFGMAGLSGDEIWAMILQPLSLRIIKRTISDDGHKFLPYQMETASQILAMTDTILSHYIYANMVYLQESGVPDNEYRVTQLFRDDDILAKSLPEFKQNQLRMWIESRGQINKFVEDMDEATLPKEKYAKIVQESASRYYIPILVSDKCLARVRYNFPPKPDNKEVTPCKPDPYCKSNIHASPSVAYSLSHRLLNLMTYRSLRHCYWITPQDDDIHMEILCSFMYRESVYIARRGFFARDLFLEHVALCGMRGYTEFFRQHWFNKAIQWMDEDGCIKEDQNFNRNSTVARLQYAQDELAKKRINKLLRINLKRQCHSHPMAVLTVFLANAVRHAIHYNKSQKDILYLMSVDKLDNTIK